VKKTYTPYEGCIPLIDTLNESDTINFEVKNESKDPSG
jgi:hypothetical protein